MNSVANRLGVPQDLLDLIHEIRVFRNNLMHENQLVVKRFAIEDGSKYLNMFLARLPLEWN